MESFFESVVRDHSKGHAVTAPSSTTTRSPNYRYTTLTDSTPWMTAIGDTSDPDWAAKHAHRKRKPRRLSLHERIIHGTIPGTGATGPRNRKPTRSHPSATVVAAQPLTPSEQPLRT